MKIFKLLLIATMMTVATAVGAQTAGGQWINHSKFVSGDLTNCIDVGDKVYYLSSNSLYCYDKETQENAAINQSNYLNDSKVTQIYRNYDKHYLLITYESSNIDVIYDGDEGRIVNVSDIKDAMMTTEKTINDVTFAADNKVYVATAFGYVVINDETWNVKESRIFNTNINSVAEVGDYQFVISGSTYYFGLKSQRYDRLSDYATLAGAASGRIVPIDNTHFFLCTNSLVGTRTIKVNASTGAVTLGSTAIVSKKPITVQPYSGGYVISFSGQTYYYTTDAQGLNKKQVTTTAAELYTSSEGEGKWWVLGANGLAHIVDGERSTAIKPNAIEIASPIHLVYDERIDRLYVTTTGANRALSMENQTAAAGICALDGDKWSNIMPTNIPTSPNYKRGWYFPLLDPTHTDRYYLPDWWYGLYYIENGDYKFSYNETNSAMQKLSGIVHPHAVIDRNGNLWATQTIGTEFYALPAAKVGTATTASDWVTTSVTASTGDKGGIRTFICTKDNIKVYFSGTYGTELLLFNDGGNLSGNIPTYSATRLIDKDGKSFTWTWITCLAEDKTGRVWIGTKGGIAYINPTEAFNGSTFTCTRPKINRNDGTGLADYLLDAIVITGISVDSQDRKWISTIDDGVYLVNSDGTEVIEHFTAENSGLPSNAVYEACCNTTSGSVYFTTGAGFTEYKAASISAAEDYSNVVAYPNPVRPDFTGLITIKGLMANTLLKITDNSGNVVKQMRADNGYATWDGCNENGERVDTGVYFVFASQAGSGSSASAVTKILIVR